MDALSRPARASAPKFVTGSLLRHILVMTGTGAAGLMAIFASDLANMLFLSLLRDEAVVAAIGYGSSILFLTISIGIGLAIAATSLVSPALGAGRRVRARRLSANAHVLSFVVSAALAVIVFLAAPAMLDLLGAAGRTRDMALDYLWILVPTLPLLALGMTSTAVLRSVGDARRAMNVTLFGAIVNVLLDPIFIFGLGLGIHGAAIASALARFFMAGIGLYGVIRVHKLMSRPRVRPLLSDAPALMGIAGPAILTNIATPVANAYVTAAIAAHGDSAVAGWAIVGRVMPVAFGAVYALTGAVGPILGQNWGAGSFARLRRTFTLSLYVTVGFTVAAWLILAIAAEPIARLFHASPEAASLIVLYCRWLSPLFVFMGALFLSNAAFNTLGKPRLSTLLNWGRATLGTIPFVALGGMMAGAPGVLAGNMLGGILFGAVAVWLCYRHMDGLARTPGRPPAAEVAPPPEMLEPGPQAASAMAALTPETDEAKSG